jgi:hypothetical protein
MSSEVAPVKELVISADSTVDGNPLKPYRFPERHRFGSDASQDQIVR